jgi:hypothetical protein
MPCRFLPVYPIIRNFIAIIFGFQLLIWCSGTCTQLASSFAMRPLHRTISQRVMSVGHPSRTLRVVGGQWRTLPPGRTCQPLMTANKVAFPSGQHWISMRCGSSSSSASASSDSGAAKSDPSEYEHWVRRLYMTNMFHPVKLGLQNIQRIHDLLGRPMDDVRTRTILE